MKSFFKRSKQPKEENIKSKIAAAKADKTTPDAILNVLEDLDQSNTALQKERDRAQKYLDVAGVILMTLDNDGNIIMMNRKGCELLNASEEDIVGKNWFDNFVATTHRKRNKELFDEVVKGEKDLPETSDCSVLPKDKEERILRWKNVLLKDQMGNIKGILRSGEDLTEQIKIMAQLEKERRFREKLIEHGGIPILAFKSDGEVLIANEELVKVTGYTKEELKPLDEALKKICPSEEVQQKVLKAVKAAEKENVHDFVFPILNKEGTTRILVSNITTISDEGAGTRTVMFMRDLAEIFELEQQIRHWAGNGFTQENLEEQNEKQENLPEDSSIEISDNFKKKLKKHK